MKTLLAFLCNSAIVDQAGNVSALGIYFSIYSPFFPFNIAPVTLVAVLQGDENDVGHHSAQINMLSSTGDRIVSPINCSFSIANRVILTLIATFQNLLVPASGKYVVNVVVDNGLLIENVPLVVRQTGQGVCN
jgi:hypothetical protein